MYKDKVTINKREVIPNSTDPMIPVDFCRKVISNFTSEVMISKFDFSENKMNALYMTEIIRTDWLQMLDE